MILEPRCTAGLLKPVYSNPGYANPGYSNQPYNNDGFNVPGYTSSGYLKVPRSEITIIETVDCNVDDPQYDTPMDTGYGCNMDGCNVDGCNMDGCNMDGCNMDSCNVNGCNVNGCNMNGCRRKSCNRNSFIMNICNMNNMEPPNDCCESEQQRLGALCLRMCCIAHTIWGAIYMAAGAVQLVAGIFFLVSLPIFKVGSNIWTGLFNIAIGMITLLLSGYYTLNHCRSIKLLYMTIFLLLLNVVNFVILEVGEWGLLLTPAARFVLADDKYSDLAYYARGVTSVVTVIVILTALLDSVLTFCSLQYLFGCCENKCCDKDEEACPNDCISDIDYMMPREKPRTVCSSKTHIVSTCAPTWVFDGDPGPAVQATPSIRHYPSAPVHSDPMTYPLNYNRENHYSTPIVQDNAGVVTVRVDDTSGLVTDGDRKINHMKSFSRTPSPAEASQSSSSSSIPPICECLERLSQPTAYSSKLNSYRMSREGSRGGSTRPRVLSGEKEHYASLMVELEKSFVNKKETKTSSYSMQPCTSSKHKYSSSGCNESCTNTIDSRQRGSDAEFSKELEAALKLIQDLESPNTIDTPSETCKAVVESCRGNRRQSHDDKNDNDSTKTLSGSSSLDAHGKNTKTLPVESQSTSGYNSPSLDRSSRFTPTGGVSSSDLSASQEKGLSCVIRHLGDTAVISLFSPTKEPHPYSSTIQVSGESESSNEEDKSSHAKRTNSLVDLKRKTLDGDEGFSKAKIRRWRQFIERRRRPSLLPEVESAIMKSESLAFLTKSELEDRLNQTKNIHRQIEAKVHRQRSLRKADSFGSVEDIIDRYGVSTYL